MTNSDFWQLRTTAIILQHEVSYRAGINRTRIALWERGHLHLHPEELERLEAAQLLQSKSA